MYAADLENGEVLSLKEEISVYETFGASGSPALTGTVNMQDKLSPHVCVMWYVIHAHAIATIHRHIPMLCNIHICM